MAWSGAASTSKALEVPAALAACQGLSEGTQVRVHALPSTPIASRVSVEPANVDDWEQVELNAEFMEEQLLNQVNSHSQSGTMRSGSCSVALTSIYTSMYIGVLTDWSEDLTFVPEKGTHSCP